MDKKALFAFLGLVLASLAGRSQELHSGLDETGSAQLAELLSQAKSAASLVNNDVGTLAFISMAEGGWQAHASILKYYQGDIGALRTLATRLDAMRKEGSLPQQTAVERIIPAMQDLAAGAEAAIRTGDANQNRLNSSAFQDYFKLNADLAGDYSALIGAWTGYAKSKTDLDRAAAKIASR